jgi:NDP-sugar pyrophosphorylase family protein
VSSVQPLAGAIILAGGRGTRLAPYTTILPKPLLPIGEIPILEIVLRQLKAARIDRIVIAAGYLSSLIQAYFGDGARFGLELSYSVEREPLGTAGPLVAARRGLPPGDVLVMNGDILADLAYQDMAQQHASAGHIITVGAYAKTVRIDLGVLDVDGGGQLVAYREKPVHEFLVSMGVYILSGAAFALLREGEYCDLPELVVRALTQRQSVGIYRHRGVWLDVGRPEDFREAVAAFERDPNRFFV